GDKVVGGWFNGNDTAYFSTDSTLLCRFSARERQGFAGFGMHILELDFIYSSTSNEIILESGRYGKVNSTGANVVLTMNDAWDVHYLNQNQPYMMDIRYYDPSQRILAANFDLYFIEIDSIIQTIYSDSTSYDTTIVKTGGTVHLYDGRF